MKDIIKNLAALIKVKSILTFCVIAVFMILAIRGTITPESVKDVTLMVISFYFGTQKIKEG